MAWVPDGRGGWAWQDSRSVGVLPVQKQRLMGDTDVEGTPLPRGLPPVAPPEEGGGAPATGGGPEPRGDPWGWVDVGDGFQEGVDPVSRYPVRRRVTPGKQSFDWSTGGITTGPDTYSTPVRIAGAAQIGRA